VIDNVTKLLNAKTMAIYWPAVKLKSRNSAVRTVFESSYLLVKYKLIFKLPLLRT